MGSLKKIAVATTAVSILAAPAIAATLDRSKPSNFIIWAFLACCALIIVAQVYPLIRHIIEESELTAAKALEKKQQETH